MSTVRWVTGLLAIEALICLFFTDRGLWSSILAAVFLLLFLIFCGTFRRANTDSRKAPTP